MTPEETQTERIDSLIAMLEPIFAYKSGYYYRLLMVHCIVQLHFLDTGLAPGFSDGGGHRSCSQRDDKPHATHEGGWGGPFGMITQPSGSLRLLLWELKFARVTLSLSRGGASAQL